MNDGNEAKRRRNGGSHIEGRSDDDGDVEEKVLAEGKEGIENVDVVTLDSDTGDGKGAGARPQRRRSEGVGQTGGRTSRKSKVSMREMAAAPWCELTR